MLNHIAGHCLEAQASGPTLDSGGPKPYFRNGLGTLVGGLLKASQNNNFARL
jgi:hypothetical protein